MNRFNMVKKLSILFVSALFIFAGCKNQVKLDNFDKFNEEDCTVNIKFTSSSREINPVASNTDLTNIVLKGKRSSEKEMKTIKTWAAYSDTENDSITLKTTEWDFEVTAESHKDGVDIYYKGTLKNFALTKTTETIPFVLYVQNYKDNNTSGTGAFEVSLALAKDFINNYTEFPDKEINCVIEVKARLLDASDLTKTLSGYDYVDISSTIDKSDYEFQKYCYSENNLEPGQYFIEFTYNILNENIKWLEAVNVVANYTTKGQTSPNALPVDTKFYHINNRTTLEYFLTGNYGSYGILLNDIGLGVGAVVPCSSTKKIILDLNGNKISSTNNSQEVIRINEGAKLSIISSGNKKGELENLKYGVIYNRGECSIDNVIFNFKGEVPAIKNDSNCKINSITNCDFVFNAKSQQLLPYYGISNNGGTIDLIDHVNFTVDYDTTMNFTNEIICIRTDGYNAINPTKDVFSYFGTISNVKFENNYKHTFYGLKIESYGSIGKIENCEYSSGKDSKDKFVSYGFLFSPREVEKDDTHKLTIDSIENCNFEFENRSEDYTIKFNNKIDIGSIKNINSSVYNVGFCPVLYFGETAADMGTIGSVDNITLKGGDINNDNLVYNNISKRYTLPTENDNPTNLTHIIVSDLEIKNPPEITEYSEGDAIDLTGLEVIATYADNTTRDVSSVVSISGFDSSTETESQTITVDYEGRTTTFTVVIVPGGIPMTVAEFLTAIGTEVVTITYDTTQDDGVILSDDHKTANVKNIALSGAFSTDNKFPNSLVTADLRGLNTKGVTDMSYMFQYCWNLTEVDLSSFNTSNVTAMEYMFSNCTALISADVSNFNTSNVTNMEGVFHYCQSLPVIDVSNFDTSKVTDMSWMFYRCNKVEELDVSDFDTSKVTDMSNMFYRCYLVEELDVSNFVTTNVTNMTAMFNECKKVKTLDVTGFNTSNVTNMATMFAYCETLTSLDVRNFVTTNVENMGYMFRHCIKLTGLDLSNFNTPKVTQINQMFDGDELLTTLDISNFDTSSIDLSSTWKYENIFTNCGTATTPLVITIGANWNLDTGSTSYGGTNLSFVTK